MASDAHRFLLAVADADADGADPDVLLARLDRELGPSELLRLRTGAAVLIAAIDRLIVRKRSLL